jgi:hypothetical protein
MDSGSEAHLATIIPNFFLSEPEGFQVQKKAEGGSFEPTLRHDVKVEPCQTNAIRTAARL